MVIAVGYFRSSPSPTGIFAFNGVNKWHIPNPDAMVFMQKAFPGLGPSGKGNYDWTDWPNPAGGPATQSAAWDKFLDSIPESK